MLVGPEAAHGFGGGPPEQRLAAGLIGDQFFGDSDGAGGDGLGGGGGRVRVVGGDVARIEDDAGLRHGPAVAGEVGEGDAQVFAALDGFDDVGLLGRRRGGRHVDAAHEFVGDAEDVGVFGAGLLRVGVGFEGGAAEGAAGDLLAEQLGGEGAEAEDVGDGFGVPALGEHADGDDAADLLAGFALAADGVEDVADGLDLLLFGRAGGGVQFGLFGGDSAERGDAVVFGVAELRVDEQGGRSLDVVGAVAAHVGEGFEPAGVQAAVFVAVAGDPAEQGGGVGDVVGDGDHHGDHAVFGVFGLDGVGVVVVHALEQAAHGLLEVCAVERFGFGLVVEIAVDGIVVAGVVVDREAGDFGEAGFDCVGERVVADGPGEVFGAEFSGAPQVHGGGGEVEDLGEASLGVQGLERGEPERGAALFVFHFFGGFADAGFDHAVAVMRFVVDHDERIVGAVTGEEAIEHRLFGFFPARVGGFAQQASHGGGRGVAAPVDVEVVLRLELLEVEDGDTEAVEVGAEVERGELRQQVFGVVGFEFGEAVFDGEVGGDDQEVVGH